MDRIRTGFIPEWTEEKWFISGRTAGTWVVSGPEDRDLVTHQIQAWSLPMLTDQVADVADGIGG